MRATRFASAGFTVAGSGAGTRLMCSMNSSHSLAALNGGAPVSVSYKSSPSAYTSQAGPTA